MLTIYSQLGDWERSVLKFEFDQYLSFKAWNLRQGLCLNKIKSGNTIYKKSNLDFVYL